MSLITPDFGLLVWMTLIFGIVFFVLAKWGFPMITGSVEKRAQRIGESIKAAKEAEERLRNLAEEQSRMIEEARQEQSRILKEASASRDSIVEQAKDQARAEASRILDQARIQIAAEKESALRDVRKEVALLLVLREGGQKRPVGDVIDAVADIPEDVGHGEEDDVGRAGADVAEKDQIEDHGHDAADQDRGLEFAPFCVDIVNGKARDGVVQRVGDAQDGEHKTYRCEHMNG